MEPELLAIGFNLEPDPDLINLVIEQGKGSMNPSDEYQLLGMYVDTSGAKITAGVGAYGMYVDAGLVSRRRCNAEVFRICNTLAHVDVLDDEGQVRGRFLAYVDDPISYPLYALDEVGPRREVAVAVSALGFDVDVFDDMDAYKASQTPMFGRAVFAAHLVSAWIFDLYSGEAAADRVTGGATLSGLCDVVERLVNSVTGAEFWYVEIEAASLPISVAVSVDLVPHLEPGKVLAGRFVLVVSDGELEAELSL